MLSLKKPIYLVMPSFDTTYLEKTTNIGKITAIAAIKITATISSGGKDDAMFAMLKRARRLIIIETISATKSNAATI